MSVSGCALCGKRVGSGGRVELIRSTPVPDTRYWHDDCWRQHSNPGSDDGMTILVVAVRALGRRRGSTTVATTLASL